MTRNKGRLTHNILRMVLALCPATDVLLVPHSVLYALGAGMLLVTACCCVASRKSADSRRARSGRLSFSRMYASKSGMRGIEARDDRAGMV